MNLFSRRNLKLREFVDPSWPVERIASKPVVTIRENKKVRDVIEIMLERFRSIPVIRKDGSIHGITGITDVLNYLFTRQKSASLNNVLSKNMVVVSRKTKAGSALMTMKTGKTGTFPVVSGEKLYGILTEWDYVNLITRDFLRRKTGISVERVMTKRVFKVAEDLSIPDLAKLIANGYRRLPVVENDILIGIVTAYDVLAFLKNNNFRIPREANTGDIMTKNVVWVEPENDIRDAIRIMKERRIGGLPVTEDGEVVGIVTERDIVELLA